MRCDACCSSHDHLLSHLQPLMADASAHCANGCYWPKVSSGLWAGSRDHSCPSRAQKSPFCPSGKTQPFRYCLYPQTPTPASSRALPYSERSRDPQRPPARAGAAPAPQTGALPTSCRAPAPGTSPQPLREGSRAAGQLQYITWHMAHAA